MRDLLLGSTRTQCAAVRAAARAVAAAFVAEQRALAALYTDTPEQQREFVAGELACLLHLSPATGSARLERALQLLAQPRLVAALETGLLAVPHALTLLGEIEHLDPPHAAHVLADVLGDGPIDSDGRLDQTPGQLRAAARRAAIRTDPEATRRRHAAAARRAGVRGRPGTDGMGQVVIDCTAAQMATTLAAVRGRAAAMTFDDPDLTLGQRQVAALMHALTCERVGVTAVIECPVERALDLPALASAPVWTVDVRMPAAVALGLSDSPAVLTGYGPIDPDTARALLPAADLVRACVDATTGEVLTADPPIRHATWSRNGTTARQRNRPDPDAQRPMPTGGVTGRPSAVTGSAAAPDRQTAAALRATLIHMATSGATLTDLSTDSYTPTAAIARLVDLRDVTSTFPGDLTPARRTDRDHRLPWPLGPTSPDNLQHLTRHWHRAKHSGWHTTLLPDGTTRWTSPGGGTYHRRPDRTVPPPIPPGTVLPPLSP
jgi:hypothetical protein